MEELKIYTSYHDKSLVEQYSLKETDVLVPFDTSTNPLHPYLNEFITQQTVWKEGMKSERVGFQQYRTLIREEDYGKEFFGVLKKTSPFSIKTNTIDNLRAPKLCDEFLDYVKCNYAEDSRVYKCFVEECDVKRSWFVKETYILKWEYFDEMVGLISNFIDHLDEKYGLNHEPEKYKDFALRLIDVPNGQWNRHRGLGYFIEGAIGLYLGYLYTEMYQDSDIRLF